MISYIVAMKFISWIFALMVLFGYGTILRCENELCRKYPTVDDEMVRMGMEKIIEDYNSRSWTGRVALVIYWGASMMTIPFMIIENIRKRGKKDE